LPVRGAAGAVVSLNTSFGPRRGRGGFAARVAARVDARVSARLGDAQLLFARVHFLLVAGIPGETGGGDDDLTLRLSRVRRGGGGLGRGFGRRDRPPRVAGAGQVAALVAGGVAAVGRALVLDPDGRLRLAEQQAVDQFHALHQGVVGVGDLVLPHAEPAAGVDVVVLQVRNDLREDSVALDRRGRVAVVGVVGPRVDDVFAVGIIQQAGVDEAGDG